MRGALRPVGNCKTAKNIWLKLKSPNKKSRKLKNKTEDVNNQSRKKKLTKTGNCAKNNNCQKSPNLKDQCHPQNISDIYLLTDFKPRFQSNF